MFIEQHDAKVSNTLGDKRFVWKRIGNKKLEPSKDHPLDYPISFGIELEYEVKTPESIEDNAEKKLYRTQIADRLEPFYKQFAIAKHDGSLTNGFEVVSVPMSIDAHSEQWKKFFAEGPENGLTVKTNCGMHVHVSRELLTPLQIGKIMAMIFSKDNAKFLKIIAGRAKPVMKKDRTYTEIGVKKITDVNKHAERYSALNLGNSETIEFRFFKSTLDLDRMLTNIEFCDALIRFAWPSTSSIQEVRDKGLELFGQFVANNRKLYPHLAAFMKDNGYASWSQKRVPMRFQLQAPPKAVVVKPPIKKKTLLDSRKKKLFANLLYDDDYSWDL
jgi:hypothetical protein